MAAIAAELASFLCSQRFSDLPPRAIEHAKMLLLSTLSSAALGSTLESTQIIRALETERGGRADATLWFGDGAKLPAAAAARVNALASDAAASDDSDLRNIVHQGTTACATALAVAEMAGADGADTLAAIVLGYEAAGRISSAMQCGFKDKGFHGCIVACFAGAAAAAHLMRLSVEETTHTIALAATSIGGLSAAANGSCAREYHAGQAAMQGVLAAQAAGRGFRAEPHVLEMRGGFFEVFGRDADIGAVLRDAGTRWSILVDMGIKLVPGGHPNHAVAEAAAAAAIAGDIAPDQVAMIEISRPGFQGFANPQFPTDLIGIAHSAAYFAAAGVADRNYTWEHAFEHKINDPVIRSLLGKVRMVAPPTEQLERYKSGAVVTIRTVDGQCHSRTVYAPRGAAVLGIEWADVEGKYRALAPYGALSPANLERSLQLVRSFETIGQVSALTVLLQQSNETQETP